MAHWQRRARFGIGAFGIGVAIVVYAAIGERETVEPAPRPERIDPTATLESVGAAFRQFRETRQDFVIEAGQQLTYEGGATRFLDVTIRVRGREGRDFVVSGREAVAGGDRRVLEITGDVTLAASDGFEMSVDRASFDEEDAIVRAPGAVVFHRGRMRGSGVGMTYDRDGDVLSIADAAQVAVADEHGAPAIEFTAGSATLARQDDLLMLEGDVHVLRGEQVLAADRGLARLTADEDAVTFIELRDNARVSGGGVFDTMSARDIDLDYSEDGALLERVALAGDGVVAMAGQAGAAGRRFLGDALDLTFAPDASLTSVVGRRNVRVDLPATAGVAGAPGRRVDADAVNATGEPGRGLTTARFTGEVEFSEERRAGRPARRARAGALQLALADDVVSAAVFIGRVLFDEGGLQASAATARYDPGAGTLALSGADEGGGPRVADERIAIDADVIDVALEDRRMSARGQPVKTTLRARAPGSSTGTRLPGLLQQGEPANVNADRLEYQGAAGTAAYTGAATLWQGTTAIRSDVITLDEASGGLVASGSARSTLALDTGTSVGRAAEIRYDDTARQIVYLAPAATPVGRGGAPTGGLGIAPTPELSQLSGPQGDLQARRIELVLGGAGSRAERLEAYTDVTVRLDTRVATGDRLTYFADDERYVMTGVATVPVTVVEPCRETLGRTITFFRSSDRIIVDGNEEVRTQSRRSGGPCATPPGR